MNSSNFEAIERLKGEWDSLQPLSNENDERLWKKLRLEWDFHSNHIEGNTLTYGETELLVIFGETRGNHAIREYEEMKAHDVAIGHVRALARENRSLTEADVRGLNKLLLKEPFWKPAITPDGAPTQKQIIPGQYKAQPNNVRTPTGETFRFVDPLDVPQRMHDYLQVLNAEPPLSAYLLLHLARIHHEFLLIHPFDDGNGRVGRLLLNYVLLKRGFPPIIIRTEQKSSYLSALHRADTEERDYSELAVMLNGLLGSSLELGIKAAHGDSLEEPTDIEKEIAIFAKENAMGPFPPARTPELVLSLWDNTLTPLLGKIAQKISVFDKMFSKVEMRLNNPVTSPDWRRDGREIIQKVHVGGNINFIIACEHYNGKGVRPFSKNFGLSVILDKYHFRTSLAPAPTQFWSYSQTLTATEIEEMASELLKRMFGEIKTEIEKK